MSTTALHSKSFLEWGVATQAVPGQTVSGDLALVQPFAHGALIAVVDGLGHGEEATAAARIAVNVLREKADQSVIALVQRCHKALIPTRGAVMTLVSFNALRDTASWLSVGNVAGALLRADTRAWPPFEAALLRGGVVGYQLPALHASVVVVSPGDLFILATDGIGSGFDRNVVRTDTPQQIADRIMSRHFKGTDDALVLAARFLGPGHE